MIEKILFKKLINLSLESTSRINGLNNKFSSKQKPVLLLGDGISSIYAQDIINNYEFIIIVNKSILNQRLKNFSPLFWIMMEPHHLTKNIRKNPELWEIIRKKFIRL